jgi:hypothetical protein
MLQHGAVPEHNGGDMMDVFPELPPNHEDHAAQLRSCADDTVKMANSSFDSARLLGEPNSHLAILCLTSRNLPCTWAHIGSGSGFQPVGKWALCYSLKSTVHVGCGSMAEKLRPPVHRNR